MADPFLVEQEYQNLRHTLGLITGRKRRLLAIVRFLQAHLLTDNHAFLRAYAGSIVPLLSDSIIESDLIGVSSSFFADIHICLQAIDPSMVEEVHRESWRRACTRIEDCIVQQEGWLNEKSASSVTARPPSRNEAHVPVVETEHLLDEPPVFATLRKVTVLVERRNKPAHTDRIEYAGIIDRRSEDVEGLHPLISTARSVIKLSSGKSFDDPLLVRCSVEGEGIVWGDSLELAVAALIVAGIQRVMGMRYESAICPDVALTGCVGADGVIRGVDESGLRLKIACCANSWMRRLIVPESQAEFARQMVSELVESDARKRVEIVGVVTLEDVFMNRRATESLHVSRMRHFARRSFRHRRILAGIVLLLLVTWIGWLLRGSIDRHTSVVKFTGSVLQVLNKSGAVLKEINVGSNSASSNTTRQLAVTVDADDDGYNEVVYGLHDPMPSQVICLDINGDSVLWQIQLSRALRFPNSADLIDDRFRVQQIDACDLDGNGRKELLVSAKHDLFPSYLMVLDARTGREKSHYLHTGHISAFLPVDLNEDGQKEILITGTNNAYGGAFIGVLDSRRLRGVSPHTPIYSAEGYDPAEEVFYALIPKTKLGLLERAEYTHGLTITEDSNKKQWCFQIADHMIWVAGKLDYTANIYWYFDSRLQPVGISTSSQYDIACDDMVKSGKLGAIPDRAYFDEYIKKLVILKDRRTEFFAGTQNKGKLAK